MQVKLIWQSLKRSLQKWKNSKYSFPLDKKLEKLLMDNLSYLIHHRADM